MCVLVYARVYERVGLTCRQRPRKYRAPGEKMFSAVPKRGGGVGR